MKKIILILLGIFFISSVYALGCCFDPSMGTCSANSEESTCTGGDFYQDETCASVTECDYGCCTLGTNVLFAREVTCYDRAKAAGSEYTWIPGTEDQCVALSGNLEEGACIINTKYDSFCTYSTKENCGGGTFYQGMYCSNPSLNTSCTRTENTTCYGENIHYTDTCGNVDETAQECSYESGFVCNQIDNNNAQCKDLNCNEYEKKNGDRWCVSADGTGNVFAPEEGTITGEAISSLWKKNELSPLSYYVTDSGLIMRIYSETYSTKPSLEILPIVSADGCSGHGNSCGGTNPPVSPPAGSSPNSGGGDKPGYDGLPSCSPKEDKTNKTGAEACDQSLDVCGDNLCERCWNDMSSGGTPCSSGGGSGWECSTERMNNCVSDNACGADQGPSNVGSRYFSQYCLNGEIITEPCDDYRMGFCNEETGGECTVNLADMCFGANGAQDGKNNSKIDEESCDPEFCQIYSPGKANSSDSGLVTLSKESLLADLGLDLCVPNIPTGSELSIATTAGQESSSYCSLGDYSRVIKFGRHDDSPGWAALEAGDPYEGDLGGAGIIHLDPLAWALDASHNELKCNACNYASKGNNGVSCGEDGCDAATCVYHRKQTTMPIDPAIVGILNKRCQAIGDCDGKGNWVGSSGSNMIAEISEIPCDITSRSKWDWKIECTLEYTCKPWRAPTDGDCSLCGADGLPCSEYRCASIGKKCEYSEPAGADKGYCISSTDNTGPTISHYLNPESPIPPYTSVDITVNTNEDSICRFNLGNAGNSFESMQYEVDETWGKEHTVKLNVPGKITGNDTDSQYSLINKDGDYQMFVRCEDPAGNFNLAAYEITFEVMDTPDKIPPVIQNFTPKSGSPIKFNATEKEISFKLNEPSECKWSSYQNSTFADMENNFTCDTDISDYGMLNGYSCTGVLTGITTNISQQNSFYIACKDQPWLEGQEDEYYSRNTNPTSTKYILKPSSELKITEITPTGTFTIGPNTNNFTLTAKTIGGGESGKAECKWRLVYNNVTTAYTKFTTTNTATGTHTNPLINLTEANYELEVSCSDTAGNIATNKVSLQLRVDRESPIIGRVFNNKGALSVFTSEPAVCKFINSYDYLSCFFSMNSGNATSMVGTTSQQHTTPWKKGFTYLIRCKDFYNNENSGCGIIAKAEE